MLLAIGMVVVAANLRPAAAGVGPLIDRIQSDTGLSNAGADVLVALPVFCFGALAPLALALARRFGSRTAIAGALVLLLVGLLVRLLPGLAFLFVGTAIAGTAIAVANVLLPVLVRSNFPDRVGLLTGMYSTTLIGFAALAAGVSVPVADAFGGGWRPGLRDLGHPGRRRAGRVGAPVTPPPWCRIVGAGSGLGCALAPSRQGRVVGHVVLRDPVGRLLRDARLAAERVPQPRRQQQQGGPAVEHRARRRL